MRGRTGTAIALAATLVLAGCAAPTHGTPSGTGDDGIRVLGGELPVNPDVVFDRVTGLMEASPPRPDAIRVVTRDELGDGNASGLSLLPAFYETVDVDTDPGDGLNASERAGLENGATSLTVGTIQILLGDNESTVVHYVLAHELAHYVQAARDRDTQLLGTLDSTTDGSAVLRSLLEGAAVYTTNAYIERYIGGGLTNSQLYFDLRERLAPGSYPRYVNSLYIHGWRYVAWRADAPNATDSIYANPPTTSEAVIHRIPPDEEPPAPLSVSTTTGDYRRIATDRLGEAFLRVFLQNGVSLDRSRRGAAGWGNDTLRTFRSSESDDPAYVWALRFDDARNRTEFVETMRDALDATGNRTGGTWSHRDSWAKFDVRTVGNETTVLLIGNGSFLENASIGGTDANVELDLS